jgi:hypothetical protein
MVSGEALVLLSTEPVACKTRRCRGRRWLWLVIAGLQKGDAVNAGDLPGQDGWGNSVTRQESEPP